MTTFILLTKPVPINQKFFIVHGRNILSKKYREAKLALAQETSLAWRSEPIKGNVTLNVIFYYGDKRKRDIDTYLKILLDSMEGIVYENDVQITELHVFKEYDKENPRTEIQVVI